MNNNSCCGLISRNLQVNLMVKDGCVLYHFNVYPINVLQNYRKGYYLNDLNKATTHAMFNCQNIKLQQQNEITQSSFV